jgi:hypothetical protein
MPVTTPASDVRPPVPPRAPSLDARALLRLVRRLRARARVLAGIGVLSACAGFVAIVAGDGLSPLALLLPLGLVIALVAERRLARLAAADHRIRLVGGPEIGLPAALLVAAGEGAGTGDGGADC